MNELQVVWGWQPALYLFLGGMGAGAFFMAAVLRFVFPGRMEKALCASMWAAVASLAVGLLCLLTELTAPLRGLMMWQSFSNFSSWMTWGAWLVFSAIIVFGVAAVLATPFALRLVPALAGVRDRLLKPLCGVGALLGLGVAAYTGVLLMSAPGVPLWNTPPLPCLFTVSAIDTGVALVELMAAAFSNDDPAGEDAHRFLLKATVGLICTELVVIAAFFAVLSANTGDPFSTVGAESASTLLAGRLATAFWALVVIAGLLVPLVTALRGLRGHGADAGVGRNLGVLTGPVCVLVGGCALRFLMLMAGVHADPVADTMAVVFAQTLSRL